MNKIHCPNPECEHEHGLFWLVSDKDKRQLSYRCDKATKQVTDRTTETLETRSFVSVMAAPATTKPDDNLPEEWTAGWRKKVQESLQPTLSI